MNIIYVIYSEWVKGCEAGEPHITCFAKYEDAEKAYKEALADERAFAEEDGWIVEETDEGEKRFEAYEEGRCVGNHSTLSLKPYELK